MSERFVFDQIRTTISTESQKKLDEIKKEYLLFCDDFKEDMNFDPKNIYKFEV